MPSYSGLLIIAIKLEAKEGTSHDSYTPLHYKKYNINKFVIFSKMLPYIISWT